MAANLVLHCGGHLVERDELDTIATPEPQGRHYPISHSEFFERVQTAVVEYGMVVSQSQHALAPGRLENEIIPGGRYFGLMELKADENADYATIIGLRNSHDKTIVAGICCGSQVFVCDNLAFSAEIVIARRHTRNILRDLEQMIARSIGELAGLRVKQAERIEAYKDHMLTRERAQHLMIEMVRAQVVPVTKLKYVIQQWDEPDHEEFQEYENGWRLFNAVTDQTRGNVFATPKRTMALHGILDAECGVEIAQAA